MRVAIYARVSTDDKGQDPENQLRQLREWCGRMGYPIVREFVEHENGGKGVEYRKQLGAMFAGCRPTRVRPAPRVVSGSLQPRRHGGDNRPSSTAQLAWCRLSQL